jgi:hypothetical protein
MTNNIVNQSPYLKTSREFPSDIKQFTVEADKAYVDTANAVNNRTISIFPTMKAAINGESWFLSSNQRQQALRQVYTFTSTANIPHNIKNVVAGQFIRGFGEYTDGTNTYGLIYGSNVAIAGQLGFYINSSDIVFTLGGAGRPTLQSGVVVIEWLSQA